MVHNGRESGRQIPADYIEIHYEDLVTEPRSVLAKLGDFLDHDLDYDRIQKTGLGRLSESNSSFRGDAKATENPVARWKERLSDEEIESLESVIGVSLEEFGYGLTVPREKLRHGLRENFLSFVYPSFLSVKRWLKLQTPLGRFASPSALEITE